MVDIYIMMYTNNVYINEICWLILNMGFYHVKLFQIYLLFIIYIFI